MFGSVLSYVSLRLLGVSEDDSQMLQGKEFIQKHGGAVQVCKHVSCHPYIYVCVWVRERERERESVPEDNPQMLQGKEFVQKHGGAVQV
jgi:hypothetical protein